MESKTGVLIAINRVMATMATEGISKSRKNEQQGYKFRGIDDVLNALSRALVDNGLVIVPSYSDRQVVERTTAKGNALFYVTVQGMYDFYAADGSTIRVGPFFGEAMDSADKATNKSLSASYKYMALQVFCIPTEGDNDADATTHEVVSKTPWTQEIKDLALEATKQGTKAYQAFWKTLTDEARSVLVQTKEHAEYKKTAGKVDSDSLATAAKEPIAA